MSTELHGGEPAFFLAAKGYKSSLIIAETADLKKQMV